MRSLAGLVSGLRGLAPKVIFSPIVAVPLPFPACFRCRYDVPVCHTACTAAAWSTAANSSSRAAYFYDTPVRVESLVLRAHGSVFSWYPIISYDMYRYGVDFTLFKNRVVPVSARLLPYIRNSLPCSWDLGNKTNCNQITSPNQAHPGQPARFVPFWPEI